MGLHHQSQIFFIPFCETKISLLAQAGLDLAMILLLLPGGSWNYKSTQPHPPPAIFYDLLLSPVQASEPGHWWGKSFFSFPCMIHDTPTIGTEF